MKKILITLLTSLISSNIVSANSLQEKSITFQEIESQCKNKYSKYFEYKNIGMNQFAKNYLKICLEKKVNNIIQLEYEKCIKNNNQIYCEDKIREWIRS